MPLRRSRSLPPRQENLGNINTFGGGDIDPLGMRICVITTATPPGRSIEGASRSRTSLEGNVEEHHRLSLIPGSREPLAS